jgi:hypothetical protein
MLGWRSLFALALAMSLPGRAAAATFELVVGDGPGEGLNDATSAAPVGGNTATTLGAQRLRALNYAASKWASVLDSPTPIRIQVTFDALTCTATSATLGAAGALGVWRDFAGAPLPNTWYVSALANARAGSDLDSSQPDIAMEFNSSLGAANCFVGTSFYLGLDGNQGSNVDLVAVAEHEIAHGLGFTTLVDPSTGAESGGVPDAFERLLLDAPSGHTWPELDAAGRAASAENPWSLVFWGARTSASVPGVLALGAPVVTLGSLGEVPVGLADFGPRLPSTPLSAPVVAALDGGSNPNDACERVVTDLRNKIALVDRGSCSFTTKVSNVQSAGATAALVIDNVSLSPPNGMAGTDPSIRIPSVMIPQAVGASLRSELAAGSVVAVLTTDPKRPIGADGANRPLVYSPSPVVPGSSLSHWDPVATPNLLMEPSVSVDPTHSLDLTPSALADLGWTLAPAPQAVPALGSRAGWGAAALLLVVGVAVVRSKSRV